jgi:hypothetical protein
MSIGKGIKISAKVYLDPDDAVTRLSRRKLGIVRPTGLRLLAAKINLQPTMNSPLIFFPA